MTLLESLSSSPFAIHVAWLLVHALWQATLIAVGLMAVLPLIDERSARIRYALSTTALAFMLLLPLLTAFTASPVPRTAYLVPAVAVGYLAGEAPTAGQVPAFVSRVAGQVTALAPWFVSLWFCGVCFLTLRTFAGWRAAYALTRTALSEVPEPVFRRFTVLKGRFGLTGEVVFRQSSRAEVPGVIGYFRPVLLVPVSAVSGMPVAQLEAVLAHELAHIRRHDYLVNAFQQLAEILLFFHPAVWWVSGQVRREREHCCDDLAVLVSGDVLTYASALLSLEEQRGAAPRLALAATDGNLADRVRRLIGRSEMQPGTRTAMIPLLLASMVVSLAAVAAQQLESATVPQLEARGHREAPETTPPPAQELVRLFDETNDPKLRIEMIGRLSGNLSSEAWSKLIAIAESDPDLEVRKTAISHVAGRPSLDALSTLYDKAQNREIKRHILSYIHGLQSEAAIMKVQSIARSERDATVRLEAIDYLSGR